MDKKLMLYLVRLRVTHTDARPPSDIPVEVGSMPPPANERVTKSVLQYAIAAPDADSAVKLGRHITFAAPPPGWRTVHTTLLEAKLILEREIDGAATTTEESAYTK